LGVQNQHYVARCQLRPFVSDGSAPGEKAGQLHVYSKTSGYLGQKPVEGVAAEDDAHSAALEQEMSQLEGRAGRTLIELCEHVSSVPGTAPSLRPEHFDHVLRLFSLTAIRGPQHAHGLGQEMGVDPETARTTLVQEAVPFLTDALKQLHWTILTFPEPTVQAVISDAPAVLSFPSGPTTTDQRNCAVLPITPHRFLVGMADPQWFLKHLENIRDLNVLIVEKAIDEIYSSRQDDQGIQDLIDFARWHAKQKRQRSQEASGGN
jgi:hypothetical protein